MRGIDQDSQARTCMFVRHASNTVRKEAAELYREE